MQSLHRRQFFGQLAFEGQGLLLRTPALEYFVAKSFISRRQLRRTFSNFLLELCCGPLWFAQSQRFVQVNGGLIHSHAQQNHVDFRREIGACGANHQDSGVILQSQPQARDGHGAVSDRIGHDQR